MSATLGVPAGWLAWDEPANGLPVPLRLTAPLTDGLPALQCAGLEALAAGMRSGSYGDDEVIDLLASLKPYGPYCIAITVDGPMADIVRQPTVALETRYGTKVYSVGEFDALEAWCDEQTAGMPDEHRRGVADAYG
ncbi:hypothetical protein [Cupriavidus campinensis]|uniref:Uncharacterized protein n=1 Tax=Cupriavidus campinensis TaxID=151783 RepID=A0AAE9I0Y8_9BURK|nr:hypothetical protein [Cupriavidus campinensis]URF03967.1 hypothetical protein M5D45_16000 [Cupriavidus campinensis]